MSKVTLPNEMQDSEKGRPLRVLEFYSGIGGMHYSIEQSGIKAKVVGAFDINTTANDVYRHNFPQAHLYQRNIEALPLAFYEKQAADMYLMSPPCQPYTRLGNQQGSLDPRAKSFIYLLDILGKLTRPPQYILVENVKGFECSDSRDLLVDRLGQYGYNFREYLLSPLQLGIPNSRLRYYLLAKKAPLDFPDVPEHQGVLQYHFPGMDGPSSLDVDGGDRQGRGEQHPYTLEGTPSIREYLGERMGKGVSEEIILSTRTISKYGMLLDIVQGSSRRSCCFTKGYYHQVEGTGSVLHMHDQVDVHPMFDRLQRSITKEGPTDTTEELAQQIRDEAGLRYFTEHEIARLMGFPDTLEFPEGMNRKQRYRVLGNSLSVDVVSTLLSWMLQDDQ
ncbi:MAG: S-adenosyl-L-methionine-dependent methyltransferase [Piptocephalis tieghemiana]|nr:MAG: S-adenosyl-L-methionine-dependent methyltransferase [Piptocephalis tieghemiana]